MVSGFAYLDVASAWMSIDSIKSRIDRIKTKNNRPCFYTSSRNYFPINSFLECRIIKLWIILYYFIYTRKLLSNLKLNFSYAHTLTCTRYNIQNSYIENVLCSLFEKRQKRFVYARIEILYISLYLHWATFAFLLPNFHTNELT